MDMLKLAFCLMWVATTATAAELILFEHDNFNGRRVTVRDAVSNLASMGFNDKASSAVVVSGIWQLCDDASFRGRCITLRAGEYPSLRALDMNDRISVVRELRGQSPGSSPQGGDPSERPHHRRPSWRPGEPYPGGGR